MLYVIYFEDKPRQRAEEKSIYIFGHILLPIIVEWTHDNFSNAMKNTKRWKEWEPYKLECVIKRVA